MVALRFLSDESSSDPADTQSRAKRCIRLKSWQAAGFVDITHQLHVPQSFLAIAARFLVLEHALSKVICFGNKLRRVLSGIRFVNGCFASDLPLQVKPLIRERRFHMDESL